MFIFEKNIVFEILYTNFIFHRHLNIKNEKKYTYLVTTITVYTR